MGCLTSSATVLPSTLSDKLTIIFPPSIISESVSESLGLHPQSCFVIDISSRLTFCDFAKSSKIPFAEEHLIGEQVVRAAQRNGLILRPIGESVIFAPPFIISEAEIDDMFARTWKVLDEIEALVQSDGLRAAATAAAAE